VHLQAHAVAQYLLEMATVALVVADLLTG